MRECAHLFKLVRCPEFSPTAGAVILDQCESYGIFCVRPRRCMKRSKLCSGPHGLDSQKAFNATARKRREGKLEIWKSGNRPIIILSNAPSRAQKRFAVIVHRVFLDAVKIHVVRFFDMEIFRHELTRNCGRTARKLEREGPMCSGR